MERIDKTETTNNTNNQQGQSPTPDGSLAPSRHSSVSSQETTTWHDAVQEQEPEPRPVASLWKEIREYLELRDAAKGPAPIAICPMCQVSELSILGLPLSSEEANLAPALVPICGHMACVDCLVAWHNLRISEGEKLQCPVCRHELQYPAPDCEHAILSLRLPRPGDIDDEEPDKLWYLGTLPRTLPEGGTQPERCNKCRYRRAERAAQIFDQQVWWLKSRLGQFGEFAAEELRLIDDVHFSARFHVLLNLQRIMEAESPSWGGAVAWEDQPRDQ